MRYFGRVYRLEIGSGTDVITYDGFPDREKSPAQIEFRIDQTPNGNRSYAEITIYGLKKDRRKDIYEQFQSVRLTAGWLDRFGTIFNGKIENVALGREGPEAFVKLFCQSAAEEWPNSYVNKSFGKNTPQIDIIRHVASTFGFPVEIIGDFSGLPKAIKGRTISQSSMLAMNELARSFEFEWMMENDRLIVVKSGYTRVDNDTFKYSAITGLIGSPEITQKGVDIEVLLEPGVRPWDLFEVEAVTGKLTFNGIYYQRFPTTNGKGLHHVVSVVHEGNFYGDTWKTRIEGVRPRVV